MNVDVGDVFTNRMNEKVEVIENDRGSMDIKVIYDGKEFVVPKTMLQDDINNGTLMYAYTIARGPQLNPRKELVVMQGQINPHLGCHHEWYTDSFFSANKYETCKHCKMRKEDL